MATSRTQGIPCEDATLEYLLQDTSNFGHRFVEDYDKVATLVQAVRGMGLEITLASGSFDLLHEGHASYLEAAREHGDFLVVGVDSDAKVMGRKGRGRPIVPQRARL